MWCSLCRQGRRRDLAAAQRLREQQERELRLLADPDAEEAERRQLARQQANCGTLVAIRWRVLANGAERQERAYSGWRYLVRAARRILRLRKLWAFLGHHLQRYANTRTRLLRQ